MAVSRQDLPYFTATAGADLSAAQFLAVAVDSLGVVQLATATGPTGNLFVLQANANSGDPCELAGVGNLTKAIAGGTLSPGDWVTAGASATLVVTSAENGRAMGTVMVTTSSIASGDTFSLYLRR